MNINQPTVNLQTILVIVWSVFWKGLALWKSAKNNQNKWFIGILLINTIGVLEILYILFFQNKGRYWDKIEKWLKENFPIHLRLK